MYLAGCEKKEKYLISFNPLKLCAITNDKLNGIRAKETTDIKGDKFGLLNIKFATISEKKYSPNEIIKEKKNTINKPFLIRSLTLSRSIENSEIYLINATSIPNLPTIEEIFNTAKQSANKPQASAPEVLVTSSKKTYPKNAPRIFNRNADVDFDTISLFLYLFINCFKNYFFTPQKSNSIEWEVRLLNSLCATKYTIISDFLVAFL